MSVSTSCSFHSLCIPHWIPGSISDLDDCENSDTKIQFQRAGSYDTITKGLSHDITMIPRLTTLLLICV